MNKLYHPGIAIVSENVLDSEKFLILNFISKSKIHFENEFQMNKIFGHQVKYMIWLI